MWNCGITWIRRFAACLLGIASPSRVGMIMAGAAREPRTWLDRWERRIDMRVVRAFAENPLPAVPPIWDWDWDDDVTVDTGDGSDTYDECGGSK